MSPDDDSETVPADLVALRVKAGAQFRARREFAGLTIGDLAERAHVNRSAIDRLEHARYAANLDRLNQIAQALGLTLADVLTTPTPEDPE